MSSIGISTSCSSKRPLDSPDSPSSVAVAAVPNVLRKLTTGLFSTYTGINETYWAAQEVQSGLKERDARILKSFKVDAPEGCFQVDIQGLLGEGANGEVHAVAVHEEGNPVQQYALKVAKVSQHPRHNDYFQRMLKQEVTVLREWNRLNPDAELALARLIRGPFLIDPDRIGFLQERYGRNLLQVYSEGSAGGLSLERTNSCAAQLVPALHALEQEGMTHSDIKPENILYDERRNRFCIADAGSCVVGGEQPNNPNQYVVSRWYRGPEVAYGKPYGPPLDKWSFGCTLFEMFTGKALLPASNTPELKTMFPSLLGTAPDGFISKPTTRFSLSAPLDHSRREFFDATLASNSPTSDAEKHRDFKDFLNGIFKWEPVQRLTGAQMLSHPFLRKEEPAKVGGGMEASSSADSS